MSQERTLLEPGDQAPDFQLTDQHGNTMRAEELRGRHAILFFYPAAMTPGCTKEACEFRDSIDELTQAGYAVVGISPDTPEKLLKFTERDQLTYPLLSDPDKETLTAYGAYGEKSMYGRVSVGVIRSTIVVDPEGKVEHALYNVKATGHVGRVRKLLGLTQ